VARNLLDNAVAHARSRVVLTVDIADNLVPDGAGNGVGSWARLVVADDGPGVPVNDQDRIFDRFYRAESARPRDGGNGLGLPIARGLAERNEGLLDLVEAPAGTAIRLLLPSAAPRTEA
jgi:signal transduction histidine kinase